MFINSLFTINGKSSDSLGVSKALLVRSESTGITHQMMGERTVKQAKSLNNDLPTVYGLDKANIEFDLKIMFLNPEDLGMVNLLSFGKTVGPSKHMPFTSSEYPGIVWYVVVTSMNVIKNGDYAGWLNLHLVTSAPHAFFARSTTVFDLSAITEPTVIEITNPSNVPNDRYDDYIYEPLLTIELKGASTSFILTNQTNDDAVFSMTDLTALESLEIDNRLRRIVSTVSEQRISHLVDRKWFKLVYGENSIQVNNPMILTFDCLFPVYI